MRSSVEARAPLIRRLYASISKRARSLANQSQAEKLKEELGLPRTSNVDLDILQTVASLKAHLLEPVGTIVDIGAHVGTFAETAMRALRADQVICIEPYAPLHSRLRSRLQGLHYQILSCALSDTTGEGSLRVHADRSMNSLLDADSHVLASHFDTYDHRALERAPVRISTLDSEIASLQLAEPYLIKLDTQGTELRILRAGQQTLLKTAAVLVEHMFTTPYKGTASFIELVTFMARFNFSCAAVTGIVRRSTHKISAVDFLFVADRTWQRSPQESYRSLATSAMKEAPSIPAENQPVECHPST